MLVAAAVSFALAGGPAAPPAAARTLPGPVTLDWVGDMTLGSRYGDPPRHGRSLFASVDRLLRGVDIVAGNLEGTLTNAGPDKCRQLSSNCYAFRAPPANAQALRAAGFSIVNVANNHAYDFGAEGQHETFGALRHAGVRWTGRPGQITVLRRHGVRVAFMGLAPYPWAQELLDIPAARRLARRAARRADVVVAFIHAGAEGAGQTHTPYGVEHAFGEDRGDTRAVAHALVDGGADLVLGSGPHVLRGIECYRGHLIAYSLGNFAAFHNLATGGVLGLSGVLHVTLTAGGALRDARLLPVRLDGAGIPHPDPGRASDRLVRRLSREDFPRSGCRVGPSGRVVPVSRPPR